MRTEEVRPHRGGCSATVVWAMAVGFPLLGFFGGLLPVVFGTGEKAEWDWAFLYVTIWFVVLPIIAPLVALTVMVVHLKSGIRGWRGLLPAVVLLAVALACAIAALSGGPMMWGVPHSK